MNKWIQVQMAKQAKIPQEDKIQLDPLKQVTED